MNFGLRLGRIGLDCIVFRCNFQFSKITSLWWQGRSSCCSYHPSDINDDDDDEDGGGDDDEDNVDSVLGLLLLMFGIFFEFVSCSFIAL